MKNTKLKGEISESAAIFTLLKSGYSVSKPFGENQQYDLIVDKNGKLLRLQCKTARMVNGVITANATRTLKRDGVFTKVSYTNEEIDGFVIYSSDTDKCYMMLIDDAPSVEIKLRIVAPKNKQIKTVRWAKDYEI